MKRSVLISAILIGLYYVVKQLIGNEEAETITASPRKKHHLTNAFSKAKEHAVAATQ